MTAPTPDDPRVVALIREVHASAKAAGYDDPIWGSVVTLAMAVVGAEDESGAGRHPKGKASGGI